MSACAMRMCSTICQNECSNPFGTFPSSRGGMPLTTRSKLACAWPQSRNSLICALTAFSFMVAFIVPARSASEYSDDVRTRDDERLLCLEIPHQYRRILRRDHRRQQLDRRGDVDERKRRLHDGF